MAKKVNKILCEKCGSYISVQNYSRHLKRCTGSNSKQYQKLNQPLDLICQYCGKNCKNLNSLRQHEVRCSKNPNRRDYDKLTKYILDNRKGKTKQTCEEIARQQNTMSNKYLDGYIKPNKGRKLCFEYIYKDHNQIEINKWLDFIKDIKVNNNYITDTQKWEGYNLISQESLKDLNSDIIQEHRYIANCLLSNNLKRENIVHHINKIRTDNRKENLLIFVDGDNHKRFHNSKYAKIFYDEITHLFSCIIDIHYNIV